MAKESPLKIRPGTDADQVQHSPKSNLGRHDKDGRELPDHRPMEPPVGYSPSPSIAEMIKTMVTNAMVQQQLAAQGEETFEEANDFDVGDDVDPESPYEEHYYGEAPLEVLAELEKQGKPLHDVQPAPAPENGGAGGVPPSVEAPKGAAAGGVPKAS